MKLWSLSWSFKSLNETNGMTRTKHITSAAKTLFYKKKINKKYLCCEINVKQTFKSYFSFSSKHSELRYPSFTSRKIIIKNTLKQGREERVHINMVQSEIQIVSLCIYLIKALFCSQWNELPLTVWLWFVSQKTLSADPAFTKGFMIAKINTCSES